MRLTLKRVESLLARGDVGKYHDRDGLYLVVSGKGAGHWSHRYQHLHRQHWMGLGRPRPSICWRRASSTKALQERAAGIDPLTAKRARQQAALATANAAAKAVTFRAMAEKYITDNQGGWGSAQHGRQWIRSLQRYVYPLIGNRDVASIDTSDVLAVSGTARRRRPRLGGRQVLGHPPDHGRPRAHADRTDPERGDGA